MPRRIASTMALLVFGLCILAGLQAGNTFSTTLVRALWGMAIAFVIGLMLGLMGQKMLDENLQVEEEKLKFSSTESRPDDR